MNISNAVKGGNVIEWSFGVHVLCIPNATVHIHSNAERFCIFVQVTRQNYRIWRQWCLVAPGALAYAETVDDALELRDSKTGDIENTFEVSV